MIADAALYTAILSTITRGAEALVKYNSMKREGVELTPDQKAEIQSAMETADDRWDRVKAKDE